MKPEIVRIVISVTKEFLIDHLESQGGTMNEVLGPLLKGPKGNYWTATVLILVVRKYSIPEIREMWELPLILYSMSVFLNEKEVALLA